MKSPFFIPALLRLVAVLSATLCAPAQTPDPGTVWRYQLIAGSQSTDDCPVCDRVPIALPLRGSFDLRCLDHGPLFSHYALENVSLFTVATNGLIYTMSGRGQLEVGGEIAVRQAVWLELLISNGLSTGVCFLTSTNITATRRWPMLQLNLEQTNATLTQHYLLDLNAAPFQEIWFSTVSSFKAGAWQPPTNLISDGTILSAAGRVVKRNNELTSRLGIMPIVPESGLKDFDILAGGQIAFSIERDDQFSETLGRTINHGDLLSDSGAILKTNRELIARFDPDLPASGAVGLDAVKLQGNGEVWFSVQTNFFSKALGWTVGHGDILSSGLGAIIKTNSELIFAFQPKKETADVGLRAFFRWPGGEIWFVPAVGFEATNGDTYLPGDILSDSGYLVYRRSELLSAFAPGAGGPAPEADALYVVTDVATTTEAPVLAAPRTTNSPPESIVLQCQGEGRVWQLEMATNLGAPFQPASPITTERTFIIPGARTNRAASMYRVRQW